VGIPRQQISHTVDGMIGNRLEHVVQIALRVNAIELTSSCRMPDYTERGVSRAYFQVICRYLLQHSLMTSPAHSCEGEAMTTATFIKTPGRLRRLRGGPFGTHLELFSAQPLTEGHCQQSAWRNIRVVDNFGR
jgi:hypothetical protein